MRNFFIASGALVSAGLFLQCTSIPDCPNCALMMESDGSAEAGDCDQTKAPPYVTNDDGLFVNGNVDAAAVMTGKQDEPFKTISQALENLGSKTSIFVCASQNAYAEQVNLKGVTNVSIFGGFDCGTWEYTCTLPRVARSTAPGIALKIDGSTGITVADIEFVARDAPVGNGDSSIAIFVSNSPNVTLRRVTATAGKGGDGVSPGAPPTNLVTNPAASATNGHGAGPTSCKCNFHGLSVGGQGGNGGNTPQWGASGDSSPKVDLPNGNAGKAANDQGGVNSCGNGDPGANASSGGSGGEGATGYGTLDKDGWHPSGGIPGSPGNPGQGGGGGGGGVNYNYGGGGSGACGGCGGSGGDLGGGGGGSIALASLQSTVTLLECELTAVNGGAGGTGGDGEPGDPGTAGGDPVSGATGKGCSGGDGGNGAGGGGGGGGAGGISVSILSLESTVAYGVDTHTNYHAAGNPGLPGNPGPGGDNDLGAAPPGESNAGAGHDGFAGAILEL